MTTNVSSSFADFLQEMEGEAREAGPEVEAAYHESQQRHWMGRLLFERRRNLGLTQAQLASRSGVHQADISKIERAEANPTLETLTAIADALDCTLALQPISEDARAVRARPRAQPIARTAPGSAATPA